MTDASSNTAAKPNGTCWRCGGTTYEGLAHSCSTNVAGHTIPNRVGNEPKECPKCSSQAPWFHTHCGLCGTPLDATRKRAADETVWVVVDSGTIEDVVAFRTYTDAARFKAAVPGNRTGPWRCPIQEYPDA